MPELNLIQNPFKKLRHVISEKGNIGQVKKFDQDNLLYDDMNPEEMFCFGGEFDDGSEDSHFHMGYTSLN